MVINKIYETLEKYLRIVQFEKYLLEKPKGYIHLISAVFKFQSLLNFKISSSVILRMGIIIASMCFHISLPVVGLLR